MVVCIECGSEKVAGRVETKSDEKTKIIEYYCGDCLGQDDDSVEEAE